MAAKTQSQIFFTAISFFVFLSVAGPVLAQDGRDAEACLQAAVIRRERSVQEAFSSFSAAMDSAFEARGKELLAALEISEKNERAKAVRLAWNKFKETDKNAEQTFRRSKTAAWKQMLSDVKKCGIGFYGESIWDELNL